MSLQKPSQITQFTKECYFNKWHIVLIFVVLVVPCSIQYHLQTITYDTPNDAHPAKTITTPKESNSEQHHADLHPKESISHMIYVYDSPSFTELVSKS